MTRINLVMLLAVVLSAVYLVNVQYESRRLFTELDKARAEEHRLESEFDRLQVEKRAQATSARVEKLAREKLQMRLVLPAITTYVGYTEPPKAAVAKAELVAAKVPATSASAPGAKP
ncbi:MAG: cell division protein FtsL [Rhodoferax sp.]|nr:cell division protein FtsL [Rhodoferax sp.]